MERGSGSVPIVMEEEKLRAHLHTGGCSPGRCQARWFSHAFRKGKYGPQLPKSRVLERINTHIFRCCSPGNVPQRRRLFLGALVRAATRAFCRGLVTRAFATANSFAQWVNTVVFLPTAYAVEPVHDSVVQGALYFFSHGHVKPEMQGLKPIVSFWELINRLTNECTLLDPHTALPSCKAQPLQLHQFPGFLIYWFA